MYAKGCKNAYFKLLAGKHSTIFYPESEEEEEEEAEETDSSGDDEEFINPYHDAREKDEDLLEVFANSMKRLSKNTDLDKQNTVGHMTQFKFKKGDRNFILKSFIFGFLNPN